MFILYKMNSSITVSYYFVGLEDPDHDGYLKAVTNLDIFYITNLEYTSDDEKYMKAPLLNYYQYFPCFTHFLAVCL